MDSGVQRVLPGTAYSARSAFRAKQKRESSDAKQFERELNRKADEAEPDEPPSHNEREQPSNLHVAPLANGDPGSLLDLTA